MYDTRKTFTKGVSGVLGIKMTSEEYADFTRCSHRILELMKKYGAEVKDAETLNKKEAG